MAKSGDRKCGVCGGSGACGAVKTGPSNVRHVCLSCGEERLANGKDVTWWPSALEGMTQVERGPNFGAALEGKES